MKLRVIKHSDLNKTAWDACIMRMESPSVFCMSWYLDAVYPDWQGLVRGDYELVMPFFPKKKWGFNYNLQPLFSRESYPGYLSMDDENELLKELGKNFQLIHIGWRIDHPIPEDFKSHKTIYQELSLPANFDELWNGYSENVRRSVKKFEKQKGEFKEGHDPHALIELFRNEKGAEFGHIGIEEFRRLEQLMINSMEHGYGKLYHAVLGNDVVASAFFIPFSDRMLYLKGVATEEGKKSGAMSALFSHVMSNALGKFTYFDFGGSRDEGLANFNRKFGSKDKEYQFIRMNHLPWPLRTIADKKIG